MAGTHTIMPLATPYFAEFRNPGNLPPFINIEDAKSEPRKRSGGGFCAILAKETEEKAGIP